MAFSIKKLEKSDNIVFIHKIRQSTQIPLIKAVSILTRNMHILILTDRSIKTSMIDSAIWAIGDSVEEVIRLLTERSALFVQYTKGNGLALNASKTQLLLSKNAGNVGRVVVKVDGLDIAPSDSLVLLGVRFDRKFSTALFDSALQVDIGRRTSMVARLAHYLPPGEYLRQLAMGLVMGKSSHALAAVAAPQLSPEDPVKAAHKKMQVHFNDVASCQDHHGAQKD